MTIYFVNNHRSYNEGGRTKARRVSSLYTNKKTSTRFQRQRGSAMGFFLAGMGVLTLIVAAGFLYIFQVTSSAVGGYDTSSLEKEMTALKEETRQLELQAADLQSIKTIEKGVEKLNLIPSEQVAFTTPVVGGTVAFSGTQGGI